jgi:hypothetical protein
MDTDEELPDIPKCISCSFEIDNPDDVGYTSDNEPVCDDCRWMCEKCEDTFSILSDRNVIDGSLVWCQNCTDHSAHWCDICESSFSGYTYGVDDSDYTFCERCYERETSYCEECDSTYYNGCNIDHDDEQDSRLIHDYSYRPDPIFYKMASEDSNRLYFGIEIETEVRGQDYGERTTAAEYASRLEVERLAYLKSDGSLDCGFEIVTHPMSHAYMTNVDNPLWHVLTTLKRDYNMMSWGTRTCGLHVHISRNGFSGGSHQHRFLQLVYNNKEFYELLAGRSASHWAKFDDVVDPDTGKKTFKGKFDRHGSDRYSAVNTNNRNTLEMRIFRGSLNPRFVKSAVNLAHASVEYTRVMSVQEVRDNALSTLKFVEYIESKPDLYQSLNERIAIHKDIIQRIGRREHVSVGSVFTE